MKENVVIPSVGESIVEGMLVAWFRDTGDHVMLDEDLYEFETEKASVRVPCPYEGILEILIGEGETVAIGQIVATIETDISAGKAEVLAEQKEPPAGKKQSAALPRENDEVIDDVRLSPAVRRIVAEKGIDVTGIAGTGKDGRITKSDLSGVEFSGKAKGTGEGTEGRTERETVKTAEARDAGDRKGVPGSTAEGRSITRKAMSPIRKSIASHLLSARKDAAHLTTFNEINMEKLVEIRGRHQERFLKKHGVKLGYMSFFVKAAIAGLMEYPVINSRIEGDEIVTCHFYDIGVAVSTDRGLLVPVLRNADRLGFAEIEEKIADYAQRARDKKILLPELQGGTFSITNGGIFGSLMSTPIPNHPQPAILGLHAIKDRPIAVDGKVEVKPMMYVALTYDHRLIDGREAVSFLLRIKEMIEDPYGIFLES